MSAVKLTLCMSSDMQSSASLVDSRAFCDGRVRSAPPEPRVPLRLMDGMRSALRASLPDRKRFAAMNGREFFRRFLILFALGMALMLYSLVRP